MYDGYRARLHDYNNIVRIRIYYKDISDLYKLFLEDLEHAIFRLNKIYNSTYSHDDNENLLAVCCYIYYIYI